MIILGWIILSICVAVICYNIAEGKGRSGGSWFLGGLTVSLVLSPIVGLFFIGITLSLSKVEAK